MAINVADVVAQYGAYYKPGSDNQSTLRNMIYKPSETAAFFQARPTDDTIWRGTLATLNRVLQPFQKTFTPISTTKFEPNQFSLFKLKVDLQETPDDLEATYLGFLAAVPDQNRAAWPFVRWWLEQHVMPKKDEDLEIAEYFAGVYAAPADGTAGAAGTALDGLRKIIRAYNTAGRTGNGTGAISTGAPASANVDFVKQLEDFAYAIPSQFRSKIDKIFLSKDLALKYRQGKRELYNRYYAQTSELETIEDFPNISVQGVESHTGSNLWWATIPANRIRPVKKQALANSFLVSQFAPRVVSAYSDWWEALGFEVPEFIFHNDQDLA